MPRQKAEKISNVKIECGTCGGSGLYVGQLETEGTAVVCNMCDGNGWIAMKGFKTRKPMKNIEMVMRYSGGRHVGKPISYREFRRGKLPG